MNYTITVVYITVMFGEQFGNVCARKARAPRVIFLLHELSEKVQVMSCRMELL